MLCCAFFIRQLMKFSKQIKNILLKRKIGSMSSAILVTVMVAVKVEWNRNDLVVYGSLYWKNKCMDGEFENSLISHQHRVYTCSDLFFSSKVCSFYCYSDYAFVRDFSEFYLRFFFSALLNNSVDVVCYSFFVCVALCFFFIFYAKVDTAACGIGDAPLSLTWAFNISHSDCIIEWLNKYLEIVISIFASFDGMA